MEGRCNQETLVLVSPYNNESHQKLRAEPRVTVSNFKVFDHPHLRHSSGRVWLLKFSSLLPHLSIATEAQNSHIGRSLLSLLHEEEANRLQNSCWYPGEVLRGTLMWGRWRCLSPRQSDDQCDELDALRCFALIQIYIVKDFQPDVSLIYKIQTT